jgi:hypothetical protein
LNLEQRRRAVLRRPHVLGRQPRCRPVDRLPLFEGGLIAKLIYADEPQILDNLDVPKDDPAADYLAGHPSLMAIPMFDQGVSLNLGVRRF